jgi:hypothetical protein
MTESPDGNRPGRLPCQLLDHGTGYLAAAAALEGVRRQSVNGGTHFFALSLTATAAWLLRQHRPAADRPPEEGPSASDYMTTLLSDAGPISMVTPPGTLGGLALAWPPRLTAYGENPPTW